MTYAVPVFVTDSAPSSCSTPEASASVQNRTQCASARSKSQWTQAEVDLLEKLYSTASTPSFAHLFPGRGIDAIKAKALSLGLHKNPGAVKGRIRKGFSHWTDADVEKLKHAWPDAAFADICAMFPNRTPLAVRKKAETEGFQRSVTLVREARRMAGVKSQDRNRDRYERQRIAREAELDLQRIVIVQAPEADQRIVHCAIARLTPLEAAWMGRLSA